MMPDGTRRWKTPRSRTGQVDWLPLAALLSLATIAGLIALAVGLRPDAVAGVPAGTPVRIYCAAGVAAPLQRLVDQYNREFGAAVVIARIGGSGELAGQVAAEQTAGVGPAADLLVTADELLLEEGRQRGDIAERIPLARQRPVIAVRAGSELELTGLRELVEREGLRFGIASSRAAVGRMVRQIAEQEGLREALEARLTTESENVMTLAQALATGSLDAAVVWDTTVQLVNRGAATEVLRILVPLDPQDRFVSRIAVGVAGRSQVPTAALRFARYLAAPETGQAVFEEAGFVFEPGDAWSEVPHVRVDLDSMFAPVLETVTRDFAQREGIDLDCRWEESGKLVATLQANSNPDRFPAACLAGDSLFLKRVEEAFEAPTLVSRNRIVLAVAESARSAIAGPRDLLGGNWRVGIGDPEWSALGELTQNVLSQPPYEGLYDPIASQAWTAVDGGPALIRQMAAGGLDAAFVYRSNVLADAEAAGRMTVIELDPQARRRVVVQAWAVARGSRYPQLMGRLQEAMQASLVPARLAQYGFESLPEPELSQ